MGAPTQALGSLSPARPKFAGGLGAAGHCVPWGGAVLVWRSCGAGAVLLPLRPGWRCLSLARRARALGPWPESLLSVLLRRS